VRSVLGLIHPQAVVVYFAWNGEQLIALFMNADSALPKVLQTGMTRTAVDELSVAFEREIIDFRGEGAMTWKTKAATLIGAICHEIPQDAAVLFVLEEELRNLPLHAAPLPNGKPFLTNATAIYALVSRSFYSSRAGHMIAGQRRTSSVWVLRSKTRPSQSCSVTAAAALQAIT
jgi:hypothetical protein